MNYKPLTKLLAFLKRSYDVKIVFEGKLPKKGRAIYVFNHPSRSDGFLMPLFLSDRPIYFLSKDYNFKNYWPWMQLLGQIPVWRDQGGRGDETIRLSMNVLKKEDVIGIFPEGYSGNHRHSPRLASFKTGVARLALLSHAPVYPIAIIGTYSTKKNRWDLPEVPSFKIIIGKPLRFNQYKKDDSDRALNKKIAEEVRQAVNDLLVRHDAPKNYLIKN